MANLFPITLSVPTSAAGATPAATFSFYTSGYRPPVHLRSSSRDVVHNQNGVFIYRYDNGPSLYEWQPFEVIISDSFQDLGPATTQWEQLQFLWDYRGGGMGLGTPIGAYGVGWAEGQLEVQLNKGWEFPHELRVVLDLEEG